MSDASGDDSADGGLRGPHGVSEAIMEVVDGVASALESVIESVTFDT
ncbi:hypothetical protein OAO87_01920 [bacterium]|nr:hypothetical protein [bacterium]